MRPRALCIFSDEAVPKLQFLEAKPRLASYLEFSGKTPGFGTNSDMKRLVSRRKTDTLSEYTPFISRLQNHLKFF
jgi:hypothetical protein